MAISQLLSNLPFFVVYLVAGVLAVARWDKHPTTSLLVVTAAGIAVFARVAGLAVPMMIARNGSDSSVMWMVFSLTGVVSNVGLGLLVAAAFADRATKVGPPPSQFR